MSEIESDSRQVKIAKITARTTVIVAMITTFGGSMIGYLSGTSNANKENQILVEHIRKLSESVESMTNTIIDGSKPEAPVSGTTRETKIEEVSSETQRQQAVMAIPIISRTGAESRFRELQSLLADSRFKEANEKTAEVMNWIAQQKDGWIDTEDARDFECVDLQTIDRLWRAASYGKFGFSVQQSLWNSTYYFEKFGDKVAWRTNDQSGNSRWKKYKELTFDLRAVQGHLPARNLDPEYKEEGSMSEGWLVWSFLLSKCLDY